MLVGKLSETQTTVTGGGKVNALSRSSTHNEVLSFTSEMLFSLIVCVIHLCKNTSLNSVCEVNVLGARFFVLHIFLP